MVFSILHEICPNDHVLAISCVHFPISTFFNFIVVCHFFNHLQKKMAVLDMLNSVYHVEPAFNCQIID